MSSNALKVGSLLVMVMIGGCTLFKPAQRTGTDLSIASTPAVVARGAYLATHAAACMDCHSPLDPKTHTPIKGKLGAGGRLFSEEMGLPGNIYAPNITSDKETGLGNWTDDEVLRAMREGVAKDGHALFPLMPYPNYAKMSDDDARAIVAYLRTVPPVKSTVPARTLNFPLNLIVNTIPKPVEGPVPPPPTDPVARGQYVLEMASCAECHTPRVKGEMVEGKYLAGGHEFIAEPGVSFIMPNLTSDKATGLGTWSDAQIDAAVRKGRHPKGHKLSPHMPYNAYSGMTDADIKALTAYLRTVPAVATEVAK